MAEIKKGHNKYYVGESESNPEAIMTYVPGKTQIIIDHTVVGDSLRGQGVGKQLVEAAVKDARENNFKIFATCPFAKGVLESTPEYQDVYGA
ncbi:GNAT family N-acetyltransferase [Staphylococcus delphini]|uniref:GNAT family N-acetyltransferase n=1 Tax=Staphylococcus delphini TaxID=53344 RepID=UPI0023B2ECF2|nr:GNAT family N-acetyltransferase [Staphylococcus delphini]MDE9751749.1 GNAT family N-acetyltransferase [Staphylococcus delphini]MDE9789026.1 GNAT family N-acetyltransferase [Staphylococcus delphini]MDE9791341.1 GNAT family N-acetyltransferase [Staphylococcus delphini]MDE9793671.1 GNAT family N-acetyltransferase [Staphylococcus delphini]MDE9795979.1 GNAT family N-acetyltransferase [Staphylococcus delphini]